MKLKNWPTSFPDDSISLAGQLQPQSQCDPSLTASLLQNPYSDPPIPQSEWVMVEATPWISMLKL